MTTVVFTVHDSNATYLEPLSVKCAVARFEMIANYLLLVASNY